MKIRFTGASGLLLVPFALACMLMAGCADEAVNANSRVTTQKAVYGDLVLGLGADGRVALPVSNLNFEVTGTVSRIYVLVGDSVKAGDLLAELDDSNYQFAISSARNNLNKAQTSYDNAVSQYKYTILSDEKDVSKLQRTINDGFDDYSYQVAISDARVALERRQDELAKAERKAESPFDPYTYDIQVLDAEKTLAQKQKEFDEAKSALLDKFDDYTYQNSVNDAKINLERKQAALKEAEADAKTFDSYSYDNAITNAEITLKRKQQEYDDAEAAYNESLYYYPDDTGTIGASPATSPQAKLESTKIALEDAERNFNNAKKELERAKASNATAATGKVDSARQAVDDAARQLEKATSDLSRAVSQNAENKQKAYDSAKEALDNASANLGKLKTDRERAKNQAKQDAADQLKSARQSVADAETNLEKAITNLSRARSDSYRQLEDTRIDLQIKQINADMNKNSNASISNAEFTLEEAKLNLDEAENNLRQVKLYAPIDGQILSISKNVGESISAQNNQTGIMIFGTGGSGNNFMTLCDVTQIYLTASITEGDIVSVEKGQRIHVTIDAIGGEVFYGVVTNVDSIPTTDNNGITTYTVTCLLDDTSSIIKDGMNAYITFVQLEKGNVLLIPNRAVFMENELQYVNVVKQDGSYEQRKVVCGLSNGVQTEVISGLDAGETVAVGRVRQ